MGFYAITLGFDLSSTTKVSITSQSVNQNYLTKLAKVSRRVILYNRKVNVTIRGTDPFYFYLFRLSQLKYVNLWERLF